MQNETQSPLTPLGLEILAAHAVGEKEPPAWYPATPPANGPAWLLLAWLGVPFLLVDLALCPIMSLEIVVQSQVAEAASVLVTAVCFGMIAIQATLLNIYVAFSSDPWWQRVSIFVPLAFVWAVAGLLGMSGVFWYQDWIIGDEQIENGFRVFCALPLVALGGLVPLIFCRWVFGWEQVRLAPGSHGQVRSHVRRPASLLNMMLLTGAIAGGFGLVRLAPVTTLAEPGTLWVFVGVFAGIAAAVSLFGAMPLLILCHWVSSQRWRWFIAIIVLSSIAAGSLAIYLWLTPWNQVSDNVILSFAVFATIVLTFLGGLACCLGLLRFWGWVIKPTAYFKRV